MGLAQGFVFCIAAFIIVGIALKIVVPILNEVIGNFSDPTARLFINLIPVGIVVALLFLVVRVLSQSREEEDY